MSTVVCDGKQSPLILGRTIFDYADEMAIMVPTSCRRAGRCHECVVEIQQGMESLSSLTSSESFLRGDFRLACQAKIESDKLNISFLPLRRRPKILTVSSSNRTGEIDFAVKRHGKTVTLDSVPIDDFRGHILGIALDLGTTTVVFDLVDLEDGEILHRSAFENPQRFGGSDVMNRITYDAGDESRELRRSVINAINGETAALSKRLRFRRQEIYEIVVAGNSTMRELFFGLDVQSIGQRPYKSVVELDYHAGRRAVTALEADAIDLGIVANRKARVYGLPILASHVGGDVAADLLALNMLTPTPEAKMLIDVGTNTEVVVTIGDRIVCASCPAGPAFEGGGVRFGMPGYDGAIESISVDDTGSALSYRTIGDVIPVGMCGSGLIDLLAGLRRNKVMGPKGTFDRSPNNRDLCVVPEFEITLSREDASNLAQAKAANYCGQFFVLRNCDLNPTDISWCYLAGGFANYVDIRNAVEIGFLAPVSKDSLVKAGNASLTGAREALVSVEKRRRIESIVTRIEHIELETMPDFFDVFVEGCQFKPMPESVHS
ncbi:MAG: ferredoxin [Chloroflexi bacterium]|nr:ferredoxin [Chloroflexota bacterium]